MIKVVVSGKADVAVGALSSHLLLRPTYDRAGAARGDGLVS
jgi:hypothetical protein